MTVLRFRGRVPTVVRTIAAVAKVSQQVHTAVCRVSVTLDKLRTPEDLVRILNDIQDAIRDATAAVRAVPFLYPGAIYLDSYSFTSGTDAVIRHGFGRSARFLILNQRTAAGACFAVPNAKQEVNDRVLVLTPSATFTADVWVY